MHCVELVLHDRRTVSPPNRTNCLSTPICVATGSNARRITACVTMRAYGLAMEVFRVICMIKPRFDKSPLTRPWNSSLEDHVRFGVHRLPH